jgi:outer membrane immunogenic protein
MVRRILLTTTAMVAMCGVASAADLTRRPPPPAFTPPPVFTWTGFYIGASAGFVRSTTDVTADDGDYAFYSGDSVKNTGDGGIFGVDAGYNWQTGSIVFGLETDIALTTAKPTFNYDGGYYNQYSKLDSLGTVRARVGYAVDRALFYVTGGLAFGEVKNHVGWGNDSSTYTDTSNWQTGWTFGGGIEYALTNNWTLRGEALYVDLGNKTAQNRCDCRYGFKTTEVIARVGLNYKF